MLLKERRKEMLKKDKALLYLPSLKSDEKFTLKKSKPSKIDKKINKFLKSVYAYETCHREYGDFCPEAHCHYAVLNVKNGEKIWITCSRRKDEVQW